MRRGEFSVAYDRWSLETGTTREALGEQLDQVADEVWAGGDEGDRYALLYFVFRRRDVRRFWMIREGLRSDDGALAESAVAIALSLLSHGFELGGSLIEDLEVCSMHHPHLNSGIVAVRKLVGSA